MPRAQKHPTIVVADWKDTESLLEDLARALKARGIVLQSWSIGSDDTILSVHSRRIARSYVATLLDLDEHAVTEEAL